MPFSGCSGKARSTLFKESYHSKYFTVEKLIGSLLLFLDFLINVTIRLINAITKTIVTARIKINAITEEEDLSHTVAFDLKSH